MVWVLLVVLYSAHAAARDKRWRRSRFTTYFTIIAGCFGAISVLTALQRAFDTYKLEAVTLRSLRHASTFVFMLMVW